MKSSMAALVVLAFAFDTNADPLAHQYAAEIVRQSVKVPEADLEFSEWQQSVSGGYIMRFAFDVDGDGAAEQFFASSFNAEKLVCEWTVYDGSSGKLVGKGTSLRPDGFWWNPATREMLDYVRFGAEGGEAIFSQFGNGGFTTRNEPVALDEVSAGLGTQESPRQGFQRIKPQVTISLLADVVANPNSSWRPLVLDDTGENYKLPNGRLLLTEDVSRVEALRNFTPNAALAILQKPDPQSEQHANRSSTTSSMPIVQSSAPEKAADNMRVTEPLREEPTSLMPWPWIIGAILLLAVASGVLLKLRRK